MLRPVLYVNDSTYRQGVCKSDRGSERRICSTILARTCVLESVTGITESTHIILVNTKAKR